MNKKIARIASATALLAMPALALADYRPPTAIASTISRLAAFTPMIGVAMAGSRIVAVGLRGHIVYSDDQGKHWIQAEVPVSSDLVSVSFVDDKNGWAAGHYGIVLHSVDGGKSWYKQLDGKQAAEITQKYYEAMSAAEITPEIERAIRQAKALVDEHNTESLLDVGFENDHTGYAVGTFNRIFRTDDGGKSWTPMMDRTDNPKELNFYAVHADGNHTYLAGEQGMVWKLDKATNRFIAIQTPYNGTLFGLIVNGDNLLAYGMRGSLLRSGDGGMHWERVQLADKSGISGGTLLPDGQIVLANQAGSLLLSNDHGQTFAPVKTDKPMSYYGIATINDQSLALVGSEGVRVVPML